MTIFNIHEAKTNFSKLIDGAIKGREIIIGKAGVPVAKIIPYSEPAVTRHGGQFKDIMTIADDFDDPLPKEYLNLFYGRNNKTK